MVKVWNKIGKFFVTFNLVRVAIANVRWIELIGLSAGRKVRLDA